jgi:hypothetical protein
MMCNFLDSDKAISFLAFIKKKASTLPCEICYEEVDSEEMLTIQSKLHKVCNSCFIEFLQEQINQSKVFNLACPCCQNAIPEAYIKDNINNNLYEKLLRIRKNILVA